MGEILTVCTGAAKEAGEFLKAGFGRANLNVEKKADQSLVTNLDKEAERLIVAQIKRKFPAHGIIGEESGQVGSEKEYIWIIDPLDGTHNFIRNINLWGVSIGVVYQGAFVAGVIYLPVFGELYLAEKGGGAYKNDQKITVSGRKDLQDSTIAFDSDLKLPPESKWGVLQDLAAQVFNIRMLGSSARNLSLLAEGNLDAIIEFNDYPWDFAAGACILEEAGGSITNLQGGLLTHKERGFLASNGIIHDRLQKLIRANMEK